MNAVFLDGLLVSAGVVEGSESSCHADTLAQHEEEAAAAPDHVICV